MRVIYDIGIRIYSLAVGIAALWNRKAGLWVRGRRKWVEKLENRFAPTDRVVWFHCASLGEFEQGRPVMEAIRDRNPEYRILLTFFSPSGFEKRKNYEGADHVMYLPLDTARNAKKFTGMVPLEMAFFIKYEFWYHFLRQLNHKGVPVYLASGIFRPGQLFFRWYGSWYRKFLRYFTHIFVQQQDSLELLRKAGFRKASIAGDTRFDRVIQVAKTPYGHPVIERFIHDRQVVVAGSTWEPDEILLEHAFKGLSGDLRWIIAPHELSPGHIANLRKRFPGSVMFSELAGEIMEGTRVIIVDTIGQLSYLYRFGTLAYIGGGFGRGIHNILEAATYSIPVIFGPNHKRFREATELIAEGGAYTVRDKTELLSTIHQQLHSGKMLKTSSEIAGKYVVHRGGATSAILNFVCKK